MGRINLNTVRTAVDCIETVIAAAGLVKMAADVFTGLGGKDGNRIRMCASDKAAVDNHSNQLNPNSRAFKAARDNHANQMNPNNRAYWKSRHSARP